MRSKVDLLGLQPPKKSQAWVHHTSEKIEAAIDKLSEAEQREYVAFLERMQGLIEDGEPDPLPQNGTRVRQISPGTNIEELE